LRSKAGVLLVKDFDANRICLEIYKSGILVLCRMEYTAYPTVTLGGLLLPEASHRAVNTFIITMWFDSWDRSLNSSVAL